MPVANDSRTVTGRVLDILSAFTRATPELNLTAIARTAGLSPATAYRRVRELEEWGALERGPDGRYRIGLRLWELAALAPQGMPLRELAMPFLEDLVELTGGNAQLAVQADAETLFIERLIGATGVRPLASVANRLPPTLTSVGLVLLAHASKEVQEEVLAAPIHAITPFTVTDPSTVRRMLFEARRQGFATSDQQLTENVYSVGAPIIDTRGEVIAALGVAIADQGFEKKRAIGTVVAAARGLSRLLQ